MNTIETVVLSTISNLLRLPSAGQGVLEGAYTTHVRRDRWQPQRAEVEFLTTGGYQISLTVDVRAPETGDWVADLDGGPAEAGASGDDDE